MPLLRGCCWFDLQLGTKIIGVVCLIFSIFGFLSTGIICATMAFMQEAIQTALREAFPPNDGTIRHPGLDSQHSRNPVFKDFVDFNLNRDPHDDDFSESDSQANKAANYLADNLSIIIVIMLVILAQQFLEIIFNSLLIHGIRKNRRGLLVPWIVMHILYVFVELALIVLFIMMTIYINRSYQIILPLLAVDLCWMALHVYFILVVVSQFQALGLIRMHEELSMK